MTIIISEESHHHEYDVQEKASDTDIEVIFQATVNNYASKTAVDINAKSCAEELESIIVNCEEIDYPFIEFPILTEDSKLLSLSKSPNRRLNSYQFKKALSHKYDKSSLFTNFSLSTLLKSHFNTNLITDVYAPWTATLYALGRNIHLVENKTWKEMSEVTSVCYTSALGEMLASNFPKNSLMESPEAEDYFIRVMKSFLSSEPEDIQRIVKNFSNALWISEGMELFKSHFDIDKQLKLPVTDEEFMDPENPWSKIQNNPKILLEILQVFGKVMTYKYPYHALLLNTHALAAFSLNRYPRLLKKLIQELKNDLYVDIPIDRDLYLSILSAYKKQLNSDVVATLFERFNSMIPSSALGLRMRVERLKGRGIGTYLMLKMALKEFKDFPWSRLIKMSRYKVEMNHFLETSAIVGDNLFYGYNIELSEIATHRYRTLVSVAQVLYQCQPRKSELIKYVVYQLNSVPVAMSDFVYILLYDYLKKRKLLS